MILMGGGKQSSTARPVNLDIQMKQYQLMVDTYLKYLDITLKFVVFTYAVTGAILSFCLSRPAEGIMRFALLFPTLLNGAFAVSCFVATRWNQPIIDEMDRLIDVLDVDAYPDPRFLSYVLKIFGSLFIAITLGLIAITIARLS
jgi:hypothetical protein